MDRRFFMKAAGASAVVIGASAAGVALLPASVEAARKPWQAAGAGFTDPRLNALSFAILAPNPHNRQPWLIRLEGEDSLSVFCQLDRRLPETDPLDRQIVIGFGAFLELLRLAAQAQGYETLFNYFPEGAPEGRLDHRPITQVRFSESNAVPDPLFEYILNRRTNRLPFADTQPDPIALRRVFSEPHSDFSVDTNFNAAIRSLCLEGWSIEHRHSPTMAESNQLTRIGAEEVNASPDGISLHGKLIESARLMGILSRQQMAISGSWANKQVDSFYRKAIESSPVFGWVLEDGDSQLERLDAGRRWVRLHLAATREGLAFHPLSQVLQEFEPMRPLLKNIHALLAPDGGRIHGLFRLGLSNTLPPSPRWRLETRIIEG